MKHATNKKIEEYLLIKADEIEKKGKQKYRVFAYQKAARSISELDWDMGGLYKKAGIAGLENIKNVGHRLAFDIAEELEKLGFHNAYIKKLKK